MLVEQVPSTLLAHPAAVSSAAAYSALVSNAGPACTLLPCFLQKALRTHTAASTQLCAEALCAQHSEGNWLQQPKLSMKTVSSSSHMGQAPQSSALTSSRLPLLVQSHSGRMAALHRAFVRPHMQLPAQAFSTFMASQSAGSAHREEPAVPSPHTQCSPCVEEQQKAHTPTPQPVFIGLSDSQQEQRRPTLAGVYPLPAKADVSVQGTNLHQSVESQLHVQDGLFKLHVSLQALMKRCEGRMQGITRKVVLRSINRRVVRQIARRATIGIPIIGFFFVSRLMFKDYARVRKEYAAGNALAGRLFTIALVCDVVDMACGAAIIAALAHNNFGLGLAAVAAWQPIADQFTMIAALASFTSGIAGEMVTAEHEELLVKVVKEKVTGANTKAITTELPKPL